jgi:NAD(P)-dependent dehydrogenase (short-subunit alcohol dehydrogenase family)
LTDVQILKEALVLELAGRTAFITGGARGIGLGIARALAPHGVKLALVDIDEVSLQIAQRELSALVETQTYVLDVGDRGAYAQVADAATTALGPVTLLFNNAGIIDSAGPRRMSYDMYDHVMRVNLDGVYNGFQTFVPRMIDSEQRCHIVSTSSEAGLIHAGSGYLYHASKYAVVGLSEAMRSELSGFDIGVSVLMPGPVATDIVQNTRQIRPSSAGTQSTKTAAILDYAHTILHETGASPDGVGELVVEAAINDRPYIHTRNAFKDPFGERTRIIQEAMDYAEEFLAQRAADATGESQALALIPTDLGTTPPPPPRGGRGAAPA